MMSLHAAHAARVALDKLDATDDLEMQLIAAADLRRAADRLFRSLIAVVADEGIEALDG